MYITVFNLSFSLEIPQHAGEGRKPNKRAKEIQSKNRDVEGRCT